MIIRLAIILLVSSLFVSASQAESNRGITLKTLSPTGEEETGIQWLLTIGVDNYVSWPRLATAVNDAKAVRDVLLNRYTFDNDHLIELYDADATRKNILAALRDLAKKVKHEDSLLIFYAGHGHIDSITKEGSWIPVESGVEDTSAWINNQTIKNYLNTDAIKSKHVLLVSDSCFAGDFFRGNRGGIPEITDALIKKAYQRESRQAITSGGVEPVSDAGFGGNSVFSHFFVEALKQNGKQFLITSDLFPEIRSGVAQNAEQFPQFGSLYGVGGQDGGEYVFFLKNDNNLMSLEINEKSRLAELANLKKMEEDLDQSKQREQLIIKNKEAEIAALDVEIGKMRAKVGSTSAGDNQLKNILAMVKDKEIQATRLDKLRREQEQEEQKRNSLITKLRFEGQLADIQAYVEIAESEYGKDLQDSAWTSLLKKYPEATLINKGDTDSFREKIMGIRTYKDKYTGMEFVYVKGGCFPMGDQFDEGAEDEKPVHEVCVDDLYAAKFEVTQGIWQKVMGSNPSKYKKGDNYPVDRVSWDDVQGFIERLNKISGNKYRLPTEAEWEFVAKSGGHNLRYSGFSEQNEVQLYANVCDKNCRFEWKDKFLDDNYSEVAPVGSYKPNSLGIYDLTGNVWEWCEDSYNDTFYTHSPRENPVGSDRNGIKTFRGGSWSNDSLSARTTNRVAYSQNKSGFDLGFRIVLNHPASN